LAAAKDASYDVVFVDLAMPNSSGFDVIEQLRAIRFPGEIVLMTGQHQGWIATRAESLGATTTLFKPLDPDEVLAFVSQGEEHAHEAPVVDELDWLSAINVQAAGAS